MLKSQLWGYLQLLVVAAVLSACVNSGTLDAESKDQQASFGSAAASVALPKTACVNPMTVYRHTDNGSSVCGTLLSQTTGRPVSETIILLMRGRQAGEEAPIMISGANLDVGDLSSTSAADGSFYFEDVPPGTYYLAVWAPYDWLLVPGLDGDRLPRRIVVKTGASLSLGVVSLQWP